MMVRTTTTRMMTMTYWPAGRVKCVHLPVCVQMALLTFCTHVFTDVSGTLTSEEVFVTLSYLNILRGAVTVAPMLITDIVKVITALFLSGILSVPNDNRK